MNTLSSILNVSNFLFLTLLFYFYLILYSNCNTFSLDILDFCKFVYFLAFVIMFLLKFFFLTYTVNPFMISEMSLNLTHQYKSFPLSLMFRNIL
jgi:hypothetical protein